MVSVTSALRYITSALRYHPRYKSRSSMYMRGLIPRNLADLAEAVPIVATLLPIIRLRRLSLTTVNSKNFRDNFIFAKNVKRHVYDVKNSRLEHDLPTTVVLPFREDFFFSKLRENEALNHNFGGKHGPLFESFSTILFSFAKNSSSLYW